MKQMTMSEKLQLIVAGLDQLADGAAEMTNDPAAQLKDRATSIKFLYDVEVVRHEVLMIISLMGVLGE